MMTVSFVSVADGQIKFSSTKVFMHLGWLDALAFFSLHIITL
jgi:hypothetical protein